MTFAPTTVEKGPGLARGPALVLGSVLLAFGLGAAAVPASVTGDVLGLGASNLPTAIGLAAAAGVLLLNLFAPRVKRERPVAVAEPAPTTVNHTITTPLVREKETTDV